MDKPLKILLGTDWWTDCDDAVALRILARFHLQKKIELIGLCINACMEYSAPSLDAFLQNEGLFDLPIGIDAQATDYGDKPPYQQRLASRPGKLRSNGDCEDGVRFYRRLLHEANDKIDIAEIGFPQVLANLLLSGGDDISPLSGFDLVKQKVRKLWMMAGKWDDLEHGIEHNFAKTPRARKAAHYLCGNWPGSITFLGWEISADILTGGELAPDDILHQVLCDYGAPNGRCSWDPMLVLMACINDEKAAGYSCIHGYASVDPENGENHFLADENGKHAYVVKDLEDDYYKHEINKIIA